MHTPPIELTEHEIYRKKLMELGVPEDLLQTNLPYRTLYSKLKVPMTSPDAPLVCDQGWQLRALSDDMDFYQNLDEDALALTDNCGGNILHYAAWSGNLEAVLLLHKRREALFDFENNSGRNVVFYAAMAGNVKILDEILKEKPALWESIDSNGYSFVQFAIAHGQLEVLYFAFPRAPEQKVSELLGQGEKRRNIFHTAVMYGRFEVIFDWGLKNLSEQKIFELLGQADEDGKNVFHIAARYGYLAFFQMALEHLDKQKIFELLAKPDKSGFNVFHTAAAFGKIEILDWGLLNCTLGLLWKKTGKDKWCLSHAAAANGKTQVLNWLGEKIPNQMRQTTKGWNIAHIAAVHGCVEVLDLIWDEPTLKDLTGKPNYKGRKLDFIAAKYNQPEVLSSKIAINHSNFKVLDWIKNDRPEEFNTENLNAVTDQETLKKLITLINPICFTLPNLHAIQWLSEILSEQRHYSNLIKVIIFPKYSASEINQSLKPNKEIYKIISQFSEFMKVFFQKIDLRCFPPEILLQIFETLLGYTDISTHKTISFANADKIYWDTVLPSVYQRQVTKALHLTEKEYGRISDKINGSTELDANKSRDLQLQKSLRFFSVTLGSEQSKPKNFHQARTCLYNFLEGTVEENGETKEKIQGYRELAADAEELNFLNGIRTVFGS